MRVGGPRSWPAPRPRGAGVQDGALASAHCPLSLAKAGHPPQAPSPPQAAPLGSVPETWTTHGWRGCSRCRSLSVPGVTGPPPRWWRWVPGDAAASEAFPASRPRRHRPAAEMGLSAQGPRSEASRTYAPREMWRHRGRPVRFRRDPHVLTSHLGQRLSRAPPQPQAVWCPVWLLGRDSVALTRVGARPAW